MLKISIISIGDELCIGQVVNTNATWIAEKCTKLGASVVTHSVIGDDKEMLISELNRLSTLSDVIITTGGLGPTHDDITKDILCEYFRCRSKFNQEAYDNVVDIFKRIGRPVTERNRLQAEIPEIATPLKNNNGTAPGIYIELNEKHYFSLPGVPTEAKGLIEDHILSILQNLIVSKKHSVCKYKVLNFVGVPESTLADILEIDETVLNGRSLAFLPNYKGIRLRLGAISDNIQDADAQIADFEEYILSRASEYYIGAGDMNIAEAVGNILKEKNLTLSVAESCTAGLLGAYITDISGSSKYFEGGIISYSNQVKISQLDVQAKTLESFGAVSEETAIEMANGIKTKFKTDFGIGITGIAGPTGGTEEKPVGTVWIGICTPTETFAKLFNLGRKRDVTRERAVSMALVLLYDYLCR